MNASTSSSSLSPISNPPPPSDVTFEEFPPYPPPKRDGFFRILGRNKQGLALVALSGTCLLLSLSMLGHNHQLQDSEARVLSLKEENKRLKGTLSRVREAVSQAAGQGRTPAVIRFQALLDQDGGENKSRSK